MWKRRNVLINGNMDIWQRSATFAIAAIAANIYTADRWKITTSLSANSALNVTRFERSANASAVPTVLQCGQLLNSSLILSVSTIATTIAAGQDCVLEYDVEGYDFRNIAQRPMNLSFWANTRQSGIYAVSLANSGSDRSMVLNYTISAIGVWTRFSLPFIKSPAAGTWDYSTGVGLRVRFCLAGGSSFQGGAGNWTAANILCTASQVNFMQSAGNTFAITGVQLEEGQYATPLEVKSYHAEKVACQRYYQNWPDGVGNEGDTPAGFSFANNATLHNIPFMTVMRSGPTVIVSGSITATNGAGVDQNVSGVLATFVSTSNIGLELAIVGTPMTIGQGSFLRIAAGGSVALNAEL